MHSLRIQRSTILLAAVLLVSLRQCTSSPFLDTGAHDQIQHVERGRRQTQINETHVQLFNDFGPPARLEYTNFMVAITPAPGPPQEDNRQAVGLEAILTKPVIDANIGSPTLRQSCPPGWSEMPSNRRTRAHLLARSLGGDGKDPRNIVSGFSLFNSMGMDCYERQVRALFVDLTGEGLPPPEITDPNDFVRYKVTAQYGQQNLFPESVTMEATKSIGGQETLMFRVKLQNKDNFDKDNDVIDLTTSAPTPSPPPGMGVCLLNQPRIDQLTVGGPFAIQTENGIVQLPKPPPPSSRALSQTNRQTPVLRCCGQSFRDRVFMIQCQSLCLEGLCGIPTACCPRAFFFTEF